MQKLYASLCERCLRECKQPASSEIVSCHNFVEQLDLRFKKSRKNRKTVKRKNSKTD
ncbi:MAG: hypothetical protein ACOCWO_00610 [Candidatus Muiribacteriaceae bacterium]